RGLSSRSVGYCRSRRALHRTVRALRRPAALARGGMSTIHLYVHGRGRGHASRAARVIPALQRDGHRVRVFTGGDALGWLAPLAPVEPIEPLPPTVGARSLVSFVRRVHRAAQLVTADDADLVISDGDVPGIWAAA